MIIVLCVSTINIISRFDIDEPNGSAVGGAADNVDLDDTSSHDFWSDEVPRPDDDNDDNQFTHATIDGHLNEHIVDLFVATFAQGLQ